MPPTTLLWLRQDLRLDDNQALAAALKCGGPIVPVYLWAPEDEDRWPPGGASRWWLHHSLHALSASLEERGSRLIVRRGPAAEALPALAEETGATAVHCTRRYEPAARATGHRLRAVLRHPRAELRVFGGGLLHEPWDVSTRAGGPFQVFTPFHRACLEQPHGSEPEPVPVRIPAPALWPTSLGLAELGLLPRPDWAAGLAATWRPGEIGARLRLESFVRDGAEGYRLRRDFPAEAATSCLSPHLHFGEISPRRIRRSVLEARDAGDDSTGGAERYLRELMWREFAHHLLYHFPRTAAEPLRSEFARFPWRDDPHDLAEWQRGRTGHPLIDAGMRQLWSTGWMHNRVRMLVASFLVKDLLLPWNSGAAWFWDTLVDADLANNTLGWQWSAGCGADAAPYFRVFNPVVQGEKFDRGGAYTRRWVPEVGSLPNERVHRPWTTPGGTVAGYPSPIVDHAAARVRALAALACITRPGRPGQPDADET